MAGCASTSMTPTAGIPRALKARARAIGAGPRFQPPVRGRVLGRCRPTRGPRFGVHIELFAQDKVVLVPAGIGTRPPRQLSGAVITAARCYGDLVTLDPTGVVLVRPGPTHVLGELFEAWGEPLSATRLASFRAPPRQPVIAFVDGRRWLTDVSHIPLARHAEIVLEVGPRVPPHSAFAFSPGA
jgi:hypothetical protein